MTFARSAATMQPMSAGSRPRPESRRSTSRSIARLRSPLVRALASSPLAGWMQQLHPLRLQYEIFSDTNPLMAPIATMAEQVRSNRRPVAADNPFVAIQEAVSRQIVAALDAWRDMSEALAERTFLAMYGSPMLQAAVGIDPAATQPMRRAAKSPLHQELLRTRIAELKSSIPIGGLREAVIRALLYAGMGRGAVDERGFEMVRRIRRTHGDLPLSAFKALVREQFNMLLIDQEAALAAIPAMLPPDAETRHKAFELIKQVRGASGEWSADEEARMHEVARLFGVDDTGRAGTVPFRHAS